MKTEIYPTYSAFLAREDKKTNGVSTTFAQIHPDWQSGNDSNEACWNCSRCSRCSGCSDCSRCSDCSDCSGCSDCSRCSDCSDCSRCSGLRWKQAQKEAKGAAKSWFDVPVIEGIHAKVLKAVSAPDALDMQTWHTCDTTHCRGGWVVTLAGAKGKALEEASSTLFAAMQIYKASSAIRVSPVRFFESNETAMEDIKRCAELEKATP